jgi:hypothetical protein
MFQNERNHLANIASSDEVSVYLEFLFQMTIVGRMFWGHADHLKQVNEISHRVLNRIRDLRSTKQWSTSNYAIDSIENHLSQAPELEDSVRRAFADSFKSLESSR